MDCHASLASSLRKPVYLRLAATSTTWVGSSTMSIFGRVANH